MSKLPTVHPNPYFYTYPYPVAYIPETFPEYHYPFEHSRDSVSQSLHNLLYNAGSDVSTPRCEIRETPLRYYLDIEVPGLSDLGEVTYLFASKRLLHVRGNIGRKITDEEQQKQENATVQLYQQDDGSQPRNVHNLLHYLRKERHLGPFHRAFEFQNDVHKDNVRACLADGVLTLEVQKDVDATKKAIKTHEEAAQAHKATVEGI